MTDVLFFKVDVEDIETNSLVESCAPEVVPCFIFYKKSEEVDRVRGQNDEELIAKIKQHRTPRDYNEYGGLCCCCVPFGLGITIIGVLCTLEFINDAYWAIIILKNEDGDFWLEFVCVCWFILKLMPIGSFIYLAIKPNEMSARMTNFIVYTFS